MPQTEVKQKPTANKPARQPDVKASSAKPGLSEKERQSCAMATD